MTSWLHIVALAIRNMNLLRCWRGMLSPSSTNAAAFADEVLQIRVRISVRPEPQSASDRYWLKFSES